MMTRSAYALLRMQYPELGLGEIDAKCGKWRDIASHNGSFAYEVGRMLASYPLRDNFGFVEFDPEVAKAINQLRGG